jgi:Putative Flp pilus-assembly TadE/G-like
MRVSTDILGGRIQPAEERGVVLVITAAVMIALLIAASYAIDTGIWFVHHRHLQTQADAAALAAAQDFQYPCTPGGSMDTAIAQRVHQYDGTLSSTYATNYNTQEPSTPTYSTVYSATGHNLFSLVNQANYENQSSPGDAPPASGESSWSGPCADAAIDVKLTETNLPSYLPFVNPAYVNAQARVSIEKLTSLNNGLLPLAQPLPVPNAMTAYLIDEGNSNAVLGTVNLTPTNSSKTTWTASAVPVAFNAKGPVGMQIAANAGSGTVPCDSSNGDTCYDSTDNIGLTYTRVYTAGTPNFPTTAPEIDATSVTPSASGGCPGGAGASNFISSSSSCNVDFSASMNWDNKGSASPRTCATSSVGTLTVTPSGGSAITMTCPANNNPNGTWTSSSPISVSPSSGPTTLKLDWKQTSGTKPSWASGGGNNNTCGNGNNACTFSFGNVQRVFSGAYDSASSQNSASGGVLAASLTDSAGNAIQSTPKSASSTSVNISVNVLSFTNSATIGSAPLELSFGGNQANGLVSCPGQSAGQPQAEAAISGGCSQSFQLNTDFSSPDPCAVTTNPLDCIPEIPGNGKLDQVLDDAMNMRINGSKNAPCRSFNYWASGNNIADILAQQPRDPRLLQLIVTDYGSLSNGRNQVPIRSIASFYVTGWAGDPCIGLHSGTSNGLNYTGDDNPGSTNTGVLLGHFVQYTVLPTGGTGSGQCTQSTSLGNCIGVLSK